MLPRLPDPKGGQAYSLQPQIADPTDPSFGRVPDGGDEEMAQLHMHTELMKGSEFSWETDTWVWQDDAACAFQPETLFEVALPGDPIAEDLDDKEMRDLNATNLAAAQKICNGCPVWDQCYTSARPEDFQYTMRAGIMPTKFNLTPVGRPSGATPDDHAPCSKGHNDWKFYGTTGQRYCAMCKVEANRAYRKSKAPEGGKPERQSTKSVKRDHDCSMGHNDWIPSGPYFRCRICKNETVAARKRELRQAARLNA